MIRKQYTLDEILNWAVFHILDYGKNQFYYWNSRDFIDENGNYLPAIPVTLDFVINELPYIITVGHVLQSEVAHMMPRTKKSKAQPLTGKQIFQMANIIKQQGGDFLLAPQDHAPKTLDLFRAEVDPKAEKMDTQDPWYWHYYYQKFPRAFNALRSIPDLCEEEVTQEDIENGILDAETKSFSIKGLAANGKKWMKWVNINLNRMRADDYSVSRPEEDCCTTYLLKNITRWIDYMSQDPKVDLSYLQLERNLKVNSDYPLYQVNKGKDNEYTTWKSNNKKVDKTTQKITFEIPFPHVIFLSVLGTFMNSVTGKIQTIKTTTGNTALPDNNFLKRFIYGFREARKGSGVCRSNFMNFCCKRFLAWYMSLFDIQPPKGSLSTLPVEEHEIAKKGMNDYRRLVMGISNACKKMLLEDIENGTLEYEVRIDQTEYAESEITPVISNH